jgi:hypothetical protein
VHKSGRSSPLTPPLWEGRSNEVWHDRLSAPVHHRPDIPQRPDSTDQAPVSALMAAGLDRKGRLLGQAHSLTVCRESADTVLRYPIVKPAGSTPAL